MTSDIIIYEQPRIIVWRHEYLRRLRRNRQEGRPVIYLDETWANACDGVEKMWVEDDRELLAEQKEAHVSHRVKVVH